MSDFCRQCAQELFGDEERFLQDCAGMVEKHEVEQGYTAGALCESCGFIRVDHEGRCVDISCSKHKKSAFRYWKFLGLNPLTDC